MKGYSLQPNTEPNLFEVADVDQASNQSSGIFELRLPKSAMESFSPEIVFHLTAQPLVRGYYESIRHV